MNLAGAHLVGVTGLASGGVRVYQDGLGVSVSRLEVGPGHFSVSAGSVAPE